MMQPWLDALTTLDRAGEASVLVTVLSARGSTPREAGCKMVVTSGALFGTIGGGNLEFACIDAARDMLEGAPGPVTRDFPLGPALGQCCGGHVTVLFEPMRPVRGHVAVFGAGHVGRALVRLLSDLPLRVTWIDSRADAFPAGSPAHVGTFLAANPAGRVAHLPSGSIVLVMTHDHQLDFAIVEAALSCPDFAAVGLIGSATKRSRFVRRLAAKGLAAHAIDRLICPIGLPGIGGKLPAEIAISVAAQLLQLIAGGEPARIMADEHPTSVMAGEGPTRVMAGEGPPSTTLRPATRKVVDADLRQHDAGCGDCAANCPAETILPAIKAHA